MVRKSLTGFTLVELLVVITIIVVLLALLVPSLEKAIAHAEKIVCAGNLHALGGVGTSLYLSDFKRQYPHPSFWATHRPYYTDVTPPGSETGYPNNIDEGKVEPRNLNDKHSWHTDNNGRTGIGPAPDPVGQTGTYPGGQLWPYALSEKLFMCPTFSGSFGKGDPHFTESTHIMLGGTLTPTEELDAGDGPSASSEGHGPLERDPGAAYSMHVGFLPAGFSQGFDPAPFGQLLRRSSSEYWTSMDSSGPYRVRPADTLLYTEESVWRIQHPFPNGPGQSSGRTDTIFWVLRSTDPNAFGDMIADYHVPTGSTSVYAATKQPFENPDGGGVGNVAFMDGHVTAYPALDTKSVVWPGMLQ